jgi:hypothetical protein
VSGFADRADRTGHRTDGTRCVGIIRCAVLDQHAGVVPEILSLAGTISRWEDQITCAVLTG